MGFRGDWTCFGLPHLIKVFTRVLNSDGAGDGQQAAGTGRTQMANLVGELEESLQRRFGDGLEAGEIGGDNQ
jgi:hypothetical protein